MTLYRIFVQRTTDDTAHEVARLTSQQDAVASAGQIFLRHLRSDVRHTVFVLTGDGWPLVEMR